MEFSIIVISIVIIIIIIIIIIMVNFIGKIIQCRYQYYCSHSLGNVD